MKEIPTFDSLMNPLLKALSQLGGSGSIDEIYEKVAELEEIGDEVLSVPHNPEKSNQTEVAYRLAWARTYLRKYGFLENSSRGIWTLTQKAKDEIEVTPSKVLKYVRDLDKKEPSQNVSMGSDSIDSCICGTHRVISNCSPYLIKVDSTHSS
ncbi:MAG: winged helix-turn-helix domain-containing protein [Sedimenticola sp.]